MSQWAISQCVVGILWTVYNCVKYESSWEISNVYSFIVNTLISRINVSFEVVSWCCRNESLLIRFMLKLKQRQPICVCWFTDALYVNKVHCNFILLLNSLLKAYFVITRHVILIIGYLLTKLLHTKIKQKMGKFGSKLSAEVEVPTKPSDCLSRFWITQNSDIVICLFIYLKELRNYHHILQCNIARF